MMFKARTAFAILMLLAWQAPASAQSGCLDIFHNPQRLYPNNTASASAAPLTLAPGTPLQTVAYQPPGESAATLEDYLTKYCTTGFLVLKDQNIVFERYLHGSSASDKLLSASMSKTVLSLLIGIAVAEGKLALTERVDAVLPDFKDSAFAAATVEDLLRMSAGAALVNSFEPGADSDNRATNPMVSPRQNVREYLRQKRDRSSAPGTQFQYNGAQTALLGAMLRQRVGTDLTSYLEQKLWIPMGAESSAHWIKNQHGEEGVQGQFAATLRDYGRLGYLVMNQGRIGGKQIVPADWIASMTTLRTDKAQPGRPPYYGLHIWIPQAAGGRAFFWGVNGQNIFIDPLARVVIVHTGNSPKAEFDGNRHLFALRDAIVRSLKAPAQVSEK
jgi:CubicO group peptidase (beta-lactamase class C family)